MPNAHGTHEDCGGDWVAKQVVRGADTLVLTCTKCEATKTIGLIFNEQSPTTNWEASPNGSDRGTIEGHEEGA